MRTVMVVVASFVIGCATDGMSPSGEALDAVSGVCASSTLPGHESEWIACRAKLVDSWPLFCDENEVPPPCAFTTETPDGEPVLCRTTGACE